MLTSRFLSALSVRSEKKALSDAERELQSLVKWLLAACSLPVALQRLQ